MKELRVRNFPLFMDSAWIGTRAGKEYMLKKKDVRSKVQWHVMPHHTGASLPEVTSRRSPEPIASGLPMRIGAVSSEQYCKELERVLRSLRLDKRKFKVELMRTHGLASQSNISEIIHSMIAEYDISIIWHAENDGLPKNGSKFDEELFRLAMKPFQRAASAAATGVPIILSDTFAGSEEFASLRTDMAPYPWIVRGAKLDSNRFKLIVVSGQRCRDGSKRKDLLA